jgi:hypothetical protein
MSLGEFDWHLERRIREWHWQIDWVQNKKTEETTQNLPMSGTTAAFSPTVDTCNWKPTEKVFMVDYCNCRNPTEKPKQTQGDHFDAWIEHAKTCWICDQKVQQIFDSCDFSFGN